MNWILCSCMCIHINLSRNIVMFIGTVIFTLIQSAIDRYICIWRRVFRYLADEMLESLSWGEIRTNCWSGRVRKWFECHRESGESCEYVQDIMQQLIIHADRGGYWVNWRGWWGSWRGVGDRRHQFGYLTMDGPHLGKSGYWSNFLWIWIEIFSICPIAVPLNFHRVEGRWSTPSQNCEGIEDVVIKRLSNHDRATKLFKP
jgi:hypothetical protein